MTSSRRNWNLREIANKCKKSFRNHHKFLKSLVNRSLQTHNLKFLQLLKILMLSIWMMISHLQASKNICSNWERSHLSYLIKWNLKRRKRKRLLKKLDSMMMNLLRDLHSLTIKMMTLTTNRELLSRKESILKLSNLQKSSNKKTILRKTVIKTSKDYNRNNSKDKRDSELPTSARIKISSKMLHSLLRLHPEEGLWTRNSVRMMICLVAKILLKSLKNNRKSNKRWQRNLQALQDQPHQLLNCLQIPIIPPRRKLLRLNTGSLDLNTKKIRRITTTESWNLLKRALRTP